MESFFEDGAGKKLELRWFYHSSEVRNLKALKDQLTPEAEQRKTECDFIAHELLDTRYVQEVEVTSISHLVEVLSFETFAVSYKAKQDRAASRGKAFYCRFDYCQENQTLRYIQFSKGLHEPSKFSRRLGLCNESSEKTAAPPATSVNHYTYQEAVQASHQLFSKAVPKRLPCREKEYTVIKQFLVQNLLSTTNTGTAQQQDKSKTQHLVSKNGVLLIAGLPGTGKTATVSSVIRRLKNEASQGVVSNFKFVSINGFKVSSVSSAFCQLYEGLSGDKHAGTGVKSEDEARHLCESFLFGSHRGSVVEDSARSVKTGKFIILVDEIDGLLNRSSSSLYHLFDWPLRLQTSNQSEFHFKRKRDSYELVVIGISNTFDLPERYLKGRSRSRVGKNRLTFTAYNFSQMKKIVLHRICRQGYSLFDEKAAEYSASQAAKIQGDLRTALQLCRTAFSVALSETFGSPEEKDLVVQKYFQVTFLHMKKALGIMQQEHQTYKHKLLDIAQDPRIVFYACYKLSEEQGRTALRFQDLYQKVKYYYELIKPSTGEEESGAEHRDSPFTSTIRKADLVRLCNVLNQAGLLEIHKRKRITNEALHETAKRYKEVYPTTIELGSDRESWRFALQQHECDELLLAE